MAKLLRAIVTFTSALFCLALGLLLWRNLTLHFAEIEDMLPTLQAGDLLHGKGAFLGWIALALVPGIALASRLPWRTLLTVLTRPGRVVLSLLLLLTTFVPLFWLRFGLAAWIVVGLIAISFFLCSVGILFLSMRIATLFENLLSGSGATPTTEKGAKGGSAFGGSTAPTTESEVSVSLETSLPTSPRIYSGVKRILASPWLPTLLLFCTAIYFSFHCFGLIPHVEDSIAQLLQARIFASGHFTAAPFPPREFFFFGFMVDTEHWFSQYPPGHPLALALGVLLGAPYLINPLLGCLSLLLLFYLLKELEGPSFALWGVWLMVLSPFVLFMSSEYMNHTTALAASLIGWLALKKGEKGRLGWLLLSGLGFGYCAATRPLEGALFGLIGGILLLSSGGWKKINSWITAAPYGLGFGLTASFYFLHNALTTGSPFTSGYELTWGGTGFGLGTVNWGPSHTLGYGLVNTFMSLAGMNVYLWEIPVPALLGVFIWGLWGAKLSRWDKAFLFAMILVPLGYLFYYFHDYCFGARYYYVLAPQLIYFSIKGIGALYRRLTVGLSYPERTVKGSLIIAGAILLALQVTMAIPYRAHVYADGYWGTDDGPRKEARRLKLNNAILFIENHPWEILQTRLHSLGFIMGDAHRLLFVITNEGLDRVLKDIGMEGEKQWGTQVNLPELERRIYAWNTAYLKVGNAPIDPWAEAGRYTYYSNGAVHLDPRHRQPDILLARDLGEHNRVLMLLYPNRKAYHYAWDEGAKRFRILPLTP